MDSDAGACARAIAPVAPPTTMTVQAAAAAAGCAAAAVPALRPTRTKNPNGSKKIFRLDSLPPTRILTFPPVAVTTGLWMSVPSVPTVNDWPELSSRPVIRASDTSRPPPLFIATPPLSTRACWAPAAAHRCARPRRFSAKSLSAAALITSLPTTAVARSASAGWAARSRSASAMSVSGCSVDRPANHPAGSPSPPAATASSALPDSSRTANARVTSRAASTMSTPHPPWFPVTGRAVLRRAGRSA
jgi:hypothetical protein